MFEDSLLESTGAVRAQTRWPAVISSGVQLLLVALLLVFPLLHAERLLAPAISMSLAAPVPVPPLPRIEPLLQRSTAAAASAASGPVIVATHAPALTDDLMRSAIPGPPSTTSVNLSGNGAPADFPAGFGSSHDSNIRIAAPETTSEAGKKLAISSGVSAGLLLSPIRPVYPQIALIAHSEGTVVVDALISKTGRVQSVHTVSGPTLLRAAAESAVEAARYRPFLLNGQPTEVEAEFNIRFNLSQ